MSKELIIFNDIPLSNSLLKNKNEQTHCYDLKVGFDEDTKLVSLIDNAPPEKLFPDDYVYDSSQSKTMIDSFKKIAKEVKSRFNPKLTIEIGSNDGAFLFNFNISQPLRRF